MEYTRSEQLLRRHPPLRANRAVGRCVGQRLYRRLTVRPERDDYCRNSHVEQCRGRRGRARPRRVRRLFSPRWRVS